MKRRQHTERQFARGDAEEPELVLPSSLWRFHSRMDRDHRGFAFVDNFIMNRFSANQERLANSVIAGEKIETLGGPIIQALGRVD